MDREQWSMEIKPNRVVILLGADKPSTEEISLRLYGGDDADMDAETIAKARLIVAAPALLAVLQQMWPDWSRMRSGEGPVNTEWRDDLERRARAALALAREPEGRT